MAVPGRGDMGRTVLVPEDPHGRLHSLLGVHCHAAQSTPVPTTLRA